MTLGRRMANYEDLYGKSLASDFPTRSPNLEERPKSQVGTSDPKAELPQGRRVVLVPASRIRMKPVRWFWDERMPAGALSVLAGREGTGKSQFLAWLAARTTRGTLPGSTSGEPRAVFYCAAEDSWAHTIAPRLVAAGADLELVYRVDVKVHEDDDLMLSLPADLGLLEEAIIHYDAAALLVDPLLSYIHSSLDSHKQRDMRTVLDPLVKVAERTGAAIAGLAHFNKSGASDASSAISGSSAFKDVPRAVFTFAKDDETGDRVMTETKNNLGRDDLPSLKYRIDPYDVPLDDGGVAFVSRFVWDGESDRSVGDILRDAHTSPEERGALEDAEQWLEELLADGPVKSDDVFEEAKAHSHSPRTVNRAKKRLHVTSQKVTVNGDSYWQFVPPAKMAKSAKAGTRSKVGNLGNLDVDG